MKTFASISMAVICGLQITAAQAVVIDFEGFAPALALINISPGSPYTEDGFTLTPTNDQSAVFDSGASETMIGNPSDWFGFAEDNIPELTLSIGGMVFDLSSVLIGPSTIASATPISMTIIGNLFGGGTVDSTFQNLASTTLAVLNWQNLTSVSFRTTDDAGLDNIDVSAVPVPTTLALFGVGLACIGWSGRRKA